MKNDVELMINHFEKAMVDNDMIIFPHVALGVPRIKERELIDQTEGIRVIIEFNPKVDYIVKKMMWELGPYDYGPKPTDGVVRLTKRMK